MVMSHLAETTQAQLQAVAFEVREVFDERGHHIDGALDRDHAFRASSSTRSELTRSLVKDAVKSGSSRAGVGYEVAPGGALQMRFLEGGRYQVVRVKTARRLANGDLHVVTNNASSWGSIDEESLLPEEPWIFGFVTSEHGIDELFVARVQGVTEGSPGRLILGPEILLGGDATPSSRGFRGQDDETLPGFGDEEVQLGETGTSGW